MIGIDKFVNLCRTLLPGVYSDTGVENKAVMRFFNVEVEMP